MGTRTVCPDCAGDMTFVDIVVTQALGTVEEWKCKECGKVEHY